jgi:hypothetical protein
MKKQLDIFDYLEPTVDEPMYAVGERVRIKTAGELLLDGINDVETIAYMTDYKFGGQKGTIKSIHTGKKVSYYVETKVGTAVVSEEELIHLG